MIEICTVLLSIQKCLCQGVSFSVIKVRYSVLLYERHSAQQWLDFFPRGLVYVFLYMCVREATLMQMTRYSTDKGQDHIPLKYWQMKTSHYLAANFKWIKEEGGV